MGFGSGLALKFLQWILRAIEFSCAGIVLGIFSYLLATLHDHDLSIPNYIRAVEGISGAACLYLILGLLLVFCLGGIALFSFMAIVLDLGFVGAFVYVAFENRHGANSCEGNVVTPFGSGDAASRGDDGTGGVITLPTLRTACRLETAAFAVSIVAIFFFLISAFVEFALARHHQREKAFGPSPANNYTQGYARRMRMPWQKKKDQIAVPANPDALPLHQTPADMTTHHVAMTEEPALNGAAGTEPAMAKFENGVGVGGYNNDHAPSTLPYPRDSMYENYRTSSGYDVSHAGERAEMPPQVPVSQYAKNY